MTDTTVTAPQTDPAAAGVDTSEHGFTKWAAILSTAVAAAGVLLSGVGAILTSLHDVFPTAGWIVAAAGVITGIAGLVGAVAKYTSVRGDVKTALINNDAAKALSAAPQQVTVGRPVNP